MARKRKRSPAPPTQPAAEPSPTPPEPAVTAPDVPAPRRRRMPRLLLLLALALACGAAAFVLGRGGRVLFAQDVELLGASITREVVPGETATLTLHLHVKHPLPTAHWFFIHVESEGGALDDFRSVRDGAPEVPSTLWGDQDIVHTVSI